MWRKMKMDESSGGWVRSLECCCLRGEHTLIEMDQFSRPLWGHYASFCNPPKTKPIKSPLCAILSYILLTITRNTSQRCVFKGKTWVHNYQFIHHSAMIIIIISFLGIACAVYPKCWWMMKKTPQLCLPASSEGSKLCLTTDIPLN